MSVGLVVFDWDGTLMDSAQKIVDCLRQSITATGLPLPADEALKHTIGLGLDDAFQRLFPGHEPKLYGALLEGYRASWREAQARPVSLFDGVDETLERLRLTGARLAVASGKSAGGLARELEATRLDRWFDATRTADQTRSKPHPRMLRELMTALRVAPSQTVMVGDTSFDLEMASRAGAHPVAVTYGAHDRGRLLELAPVLTVDRITDLPEGLLGL